MRLKLTLEYDGTGFRGWAAQTGVRTVEGALREAFEAVFPRWDGLAVAGRTDTGVHALAQVASVDADGGPPPERAAEAASLRLSSSGIRRRKRYVSPGKAAGLYETKSAISSVISRFG